MSDREQQLHLSRFLHNLGVCLHFQDKPNLRHRIILKPNWATAAIYKILDHPRIKTQTYGHFSHQDLDDIWHEAEYQGLHQDFLQLMLEFKVCYEIPRRRHEYIAPHLLSRDTPPYTWHAQPGDLALCYRYRRFMPKGILTRFIVDQHQKIENASSPDAAVVWKTGVVLTYENTRAEAIERLSDREITLRFSGSHQRDFLTLLKANLDDIHAEFVDSHKTTPAKTLDYEILIPCTCETCASAQKPEYFSLDNLKRAIAKHKPIQCRSSFDDIDARRLLDNAIAPERDRRSCDRGEEFHGREYEDLVEITKLAVSRPIHNSAEVNSMSNDKIWNGDRVETKYQGDHNDLRDANIANFANEVKDNARQQANQHNYAATQNLTQAAKEITELLNHISTTDTTNNNTLVVMKAIEAIEQNPTLRARIINAGKEAGWAALDAAVEHPAVKIVTAAIKGAIDA
jgi:internalin A